jgi:hypothetical protein
MLWIARLGVVATIVGSLGVGVTGPALAGAANCGPGPIRRSAVVVASALTTNVHRVG